MSSKKISARPTGALQKDCPQNIPSWGRNFQEACGLGLHARQILEVSQLGAVCHLHLLQQFLSGREI